MSRETDLIDLIGQHAGGTGLQANLRLGIGDDAAIIRVSEGHDLVTCTDTLVAGIHFPEQTSAYNIGWKALAVNLSDLAAMGAMPRFTQLSLTLPDANVNWVNEFMRGWHDLASQYQLVLIGGDTCRGPLSLTVQAFGEISQAQETALLRGRAGAGDLLCVSGTLGGAAYALAGLQQGLNVGLKDGLKDGLTDGLQDSLQDRLNVSALDLLNRPEPRVELGQRLVGLATSAIDLSDGLATDLPRLLHGSGYGARIPVEQLPVNPALAILPATQQHSLAISGGDDYELLFTLKPDQQADLAEIAAELKLAITVIGTVTVQDTVEYAHATGAAFIPEITPFEHFL